MILFLLLWEVCLFDLFSTFKTWLKGQRSQKTSSHLCGVWKGWLEGNLILQILKKKLIHGLKPETYHALKTCIQK